MSGAPETPGPSSSSMESAQSGPCSPDSPPVLCGTYLRVGVGSPSPRRLDAAADRSAPGHGDQAPGRACPGRRRRQARVAPPWSLPRAAPAHRIRPQSCAVRTLGLGWGGALERGGGEGHWTGDRVR
ncbi:hypothetical protein D623_10033750 [Myotis brandtii]|uniref:Uncharacterized protein n=1 Tax=Myotis brandtii TaxID=109478 RepID=S7PZ04_MYOBR|nr:hypothetical protein D623_10033750 [Myotis brandtii]